MNQNLFLKGVRDGIPVGLGYVTVGFSVGIACQVAGLNAFQGFLISVLNNASAGEYAGITVIASDSGLVEMIIMMLVVNARYLLMGCALTQKLDPKLPIWKRLIMGFDLTDEVFGLAIAQKAPVSFVYYVGVMCMAIPSWSLGTVLGILLGNLMPPVLVGAFSATLFGMFLAIFVPVGRKDKVVLACVIISFITSYGCQFLPLVSSWSNGTKTIILTVTISAIAAYLFPRKQEEENE
ncbi:MAG: AzlC family ABC transporter permease [Eubacteriales bacterium]|nr:AzlC family ABC transporter permease [Eubacteriales bacterium]